MGDSDQPLSEYLAQPGGGGAVLPSKIQQALHDALVNALDVKSAQEVQGFGPEVFVGLYEATIDEEDYLPAYAKIIERWAGNAPPQKRPVLNPPDAKGSEGKSKGAVDDDDDLASLRGGGPGGTDGGLPPLLSLQPGSCGTGSRGAAARDGLGPPTLLVKC